MVATMAATRAFFLGARGFQGHRCGTAFLDPAPRLQLAAHGRITVVAGVLGEIMADEVHGPALLHRAEVAWTLGQQALKVCGDELAFGGRTPGLRGVVQSLESSSLVGFEPGANGVCIAVSTLSDVGNTPALGVQSNIMTAFGDLGPSMACLFHMCGLFRS